MTCADANGHSARPAGAANAGPYASAAQAREAVPERWGQFDRYDALADACLSAGVRLGDYDRRVLWWLAGWDRGTIAVVAGLVTRAGHARKREA